MSDTINYIKVGGRLKSTAQDTNPANKEIVAGADAIYDDTLAKKQSDINSELNTDISSLEALSGYYTCTTSGSTVAKVVSATGYSLINGGSLKIKFEHANTVTPESPVTVTLSINSQTATPLLYAGAAVTASNTWDDNEIVNVFYDSTNQVYLAYSVEGGGLLTTANMSSPNTKKGLTEAAIESIVGNVKQSGGSYIPLQNQINEINDATTTCNFTGTGNQLVGNRTFTLTATSNPGATNGTISYYDSVQGETHTDSWTNATSKAVTATINSQTPVAYRFTATFEVASTGTHKNPISIDRYLFDQIKYGFIEDGLSSEDIATALSTTTTATGVINAMFNLGTATNTPRGRNYTLTIPKTGPTYHIIDSPDPSANPKESKWFVLNATSNEYELTEDVEVQSGTTYYYTVDKWVYFKVPKTPTTIILPDNTTVSTSYVVSSITDIARVTEIGNQSIGRTYLETYSDTYYNVYKANVSVAKESRGSYTFYVS